MGIQKFFGKGEHIFTEFVFTEFVALTHWSFNNFFSKTSCICLEITLDLIYKRTLIKFSQSYNQYRTKASTSYVDTTFEDAQRIAKSSSLVDFEYKFCITAADSHLGNNNGRLYINVKMSLINQEGKKEDIYMELNLKQFYSLFAELKKAAALMSMIS